MTVDQHCGGFGKVRAEALERAVIGMLLELIDNSELAEIHARHVSEHLAERKRESDARRLELEERRTALRARHDESWLEGANGPLSRMPEDLVQEMRRRWMTAIDAIEAEIRTLDMTAKTIDDIGPQDLKAGLHAVMETSPFVETDQFSEQFRKAVNQVVTRVELKPSDQSGSILLRVQFDLGPLTGSDPDDPTRYVEATGFVERADGKRKPRGPRRLASLQLRETDGLPDALWSQLEPATRHVTSTIALYGWSPRPLVECARLAARAGPTAFEDSIVRGYGPADSFEDAARALIRSGTWTAIVHALSSTRYAHAIDVLLPGVLRPTLQDISVRVALSTRAADTGSRRTTVTAAALDGMNPSSVGKLFGWPGDAVVELVHRYHAGDLDSFDIFDVEASTKDTSLMLEEAARICVSPAVEMRLRIAAMASRGAGIKEIANSVRCPYSIADNWIRLFKQKGTARLWASGWTLRPAPIAVSRQALKNAQFLERMAFRLPLEQRRPAEAMALWFRGMDQTSVLEKLNGSELDFERCLHVARRSGIAGLAAHLDRPTGHQTPEGKAVRAAASTVGDPTVRSRAEIIALFLDGVQLSTLTDRAKDAGQDPAQLETIIRRFLWSGDLGTKQHRSQQLSEAQIEILRPLIAPRATVSPGKKITSWEAVRQLCLDMFGVNMDRLTVRSLCLGYDISIPWRKRDRLPDADNGTNR